MSSSFSVVFCSVVWISLTPSRSINRDSILACSACSRGTYVDVDGALRSADQYIYYMIQKGRGGARLSEYTGIAFIGVPKFSKC